MEILRGRGYAVGVPDYKKGAVRIWIHGTDHSVDVRLGRDLVHLAEGKVTLEDLEPTLTA